MTRQYTFPEYFVKLNTVQRGEAGVEWMRRLPAILAACEERWSLKVGPPFAHLSYNYAAPATRTDGTACVIKVCPPNREFATEAEALRVYAGRGVVQLLEVDLIEGAMLLEHVRPGTLLKEVGDDESATSIAASVMRKMWRPAPREHAFATVAGWGKGYSRLRAEFGEGTGPFPPRLADEGERLFADLLGSMGEPVLLHGDLQHYNILAGEREPWLAIDPKGLVGEAAYEVGALVRNPTPHVLRWPDLDRVLTRRINQLSTELGFDRQRVRDWSVAQAVLSAWWTYEDSEGQLDEEFYRFLAFTEVLAGVR